MIKSGIIRVLYGEDYSIGHRSAIDREINHIKDHKYNSDFSVYVFGLANYNKLVDQGFDCVLVDQKPIVLSNRRFLCHKIVAIEAAFDQFDEVLLLDWDTVPIIKLPDNFWDILHSKEIIQAPLCKGERSICRWRSRRIPQKITSSGCFVYMREKTLPSLLLDWALKHCPYELSNRWLEEVYYNRYIENMMGGWDDGTGQYNVDQYLARFEPLLCNVRHAWLKDEFNKDGGVQACFNHPVKIGRREK